VSELEALYQQMADLTRPKCGECRSPMSCCDPMYCDMADEISLGKIAKTGHPTLKFMGPGGCVVPPHLRPLCTLHVCSINSLGFDPRDQEFTVKYFAIRGKIERAELLNYSEGPEKIRTTIE